MVRRTILNPLLAFALLLAGLAWHLSPQVAQAQSTQRIAAVVNDDIVSVQDLRERLGLALLFSGLPRDAETQRRLAPQVLRRLIDERLQLQETRRRGIAVSPAEIRGAVRNAAAANNMTEQQLRGFLADQGVDPRALEQQIEAELAWLRMVRQTLAQQVVVTDQQVELALDAAQRGGSSEVLLSEILLPVYSPDQSAEVLADAEELRAAIREGADFAAIARQVSASGSAAEGGDLGWVPLDAVQAALRPTLEALGPGQISDPMQTPAGVQLFYVRDKRTVAGVVAPDIRRVSQLLFPVAPDAPESAVADAVARAQEIAREIGGCGDVERLARQLALPGSGDLGWMRPVDLPAEMAPVINALPLGRLSQPMRSGSGIHLIMVCENARSSPEAARRAAIRRDLEAEQVERLAGRYLRDLRKDAFIDVRIEG